MKVMHLISGLGTGGAERMLQNLLQQPAFPPQDNQVVSLTDTGSIGCELEQAGVRVRSLGMRPGSADPRALWKLTRWLRQETPDLLQTWMYHADLLGGLAARLAGGIPVVWGIHHTLGAEASLSRATLAVMRLNARLSGFLPRRIICCAESARQAHMQAGYAPARMVVIPNGIDLDVFHPDEEAQAALRRELGLEPATPLIGMFARFHPQKDHRTFLAAAGRVHALLPEVHFILAGGEITPENTRLKDWLGTQGLASHVHLLGLRQDMPRLMAAVDLTCLSSAFGEALPLVLAESMACGTPCVATDVGDSALLVGETGRTVPAGDPAALAQAIAEMIRLPAAERRNLGEAARARVQVRYNIATVSEQYAWLYRSLSAPDVK